MLFQTSFIRANWFSNVELIEPGYIYFLDSENIKEEKYQENSWLFRNVINSVFSVFFAIFMYVYLSSDYCEVDI